MRQKYNVFSVSKINTKTINIALKLKSKAEKIKKFDEVDPDFVGSMVPVDKNRFLEFMSCKYLFLKPEDGIPLLKQAFKMQYGIEDEYKICKYCGKPFKFERKSRDFCSDRCRQRNQRHRKINEKRPMVSR